MTMTQETIDQALEAAAVAAETWEPCVHGRCASRAFHLGHWQGGFDWYSPYVGPTEHG
jgi:hypothetical protein